MSGLFGKGPLKCVCKCTGYLLWGGGGGGGRDVHTGIQSQYPLLTSPGSLPSDYMEGVEWAYLHYSGFPIVMYGTTKSAVAQT